jgi:hypothetical protein
VVICVPTPLSADSAPDLSAVRGAAGVTGRLLRHGTLVVLESTTYGGTTDEVVRPLLEKASGPTAGTDFSLAFSPERIDPGNPDFCIRNTAKVVGGQTPSCADAAERFYGKLCDQVVRARSAREAEMTKLLENTYRHINIALVNEMAIFSHELGGGPAGRHPVRLHQAVRLPGLPPRARGRRPLHTDRPELPVLQGPDARLPVPVRRAGPRDQRPDAGIHRRPGGRAAE